MLPLVAQMGKERSERTINEQTHRDNLKNTATKRSLDTREQSRKEFDTVARVAQARNATETEKQIRNRGLDIEETKVAQAGQQFDRSQSLREIAVGAEISQNDRRLDISEDELASVNKVRESQILNDAVNRRLGEAQIEQLELKNLVAQATGKLEIALAEGNLEQVGEALALQRLGRLAETSKLNAVREGFINDTLYRGAVPIVNAMVSGNYELAQELHNSLSAKMKDDHNIKMEEFGAHIPPTIETMEHWGNLTNSFLQTSEFARQMALEEVKGKAGGASALLSMLKHRDDMAFKSGKNWTSEVTNRVQEFGRDMGAGLGINTDSKGSFTGTDIRNNPLDKEEIGDLVNIQTLFPNKVANFVRENFGDSPQSVELVRNFMGELKTDFLNSFHMDRNEGVKGVFPKTKVFDNYPRIATYLNQFGNATDMDDELDLFADAAANSPDFQMFLFGLSALKDGTGEDLYPALAERISRLDNLNDPEGKAFKDKEAMVELYKALSYDLYLQQFLREQIQ